jgi:hypothetical protein
MVRWTCPRCDCEFGNARQAHVCVPGCTVDDVFAERPPEQRLVYDALLDRLRGEGQVHEDAVSVGVFLKTARKFAELRPMARALSLELVLPRVIDDPRVMRRVPLSAGRFVHVIRLTSPDQVDADIRAWLSEALAAAEE